MPVQPINAVPFARLDTPTVGENAERDLADSGFLEVMMADSKPVVAPGAWFAAMAQGGFAGKGGEVSPQEPGAGGPGIGGQGVLGQGLAGPGTARHLVGAGLLPGLVAAAPPNGPGGPAVDMASGQPAQTRGQTAVMAALVMQMDLGDKVVPGSGSTMRAPAGTEQAMPMEPTLTAEAGEPEPAPPRPTIAGAESGTRAPEGQGQFADQGAEDGRGQSDNSPAKRDSADGRDVRVGPDKAEIHVKSTTAESAAARQARGYDQLRMPPTEEPSIVIPGVPSAAAETPRPVSGTPHQVPHAPLARQIVDAVKVSPGQVTEIRLDPQELGRVTISMTGNEAQLTVAIATERPETADLMRRQIDQLIAEFRAEGYTDVAFSFSSEHGGSDQPQGSGVGQGGAPDVTPEPVETIIAARPNRGPGQLDLRV